MRIGIDIRPTQVEKQRFRGVGSYARNLVTALADIDQDNEYILYGDRNLPVDFDIDATNFHVETGSANNLLFSRNPYVQRQLATPFDIRRKHLDVFHFLFSQDAPLFLPNPCIVTVHDLISLIFKEDYKHNRLRPYFDALWIRAAKKATRVIAVSNTTKRDLIERAGFDESKIDVIYEGVSSEFFSPPDSNRAEKLAKLSKLPGEYLFYLGGLDKRKNLKALFEALALLPQDMRKSFPLVIAGEPDMWFDRTRGEIDVAGISDSVVFTGFLNMEELVVAYRRASAFILPSLYEGFGLPVLEAMASHTPVICANAGSLPEVAGDAAFYFDPGNIQEIAGLIEDLLGDEGRLNQYTDLGYQRAKSFSWEETARQTLAIYQECAQGGKQSA